LGWRETCSSYLEERKGREKIEREEEEEKEA